MFHRTLLFVRAFAIWCVPALFFAPGAPAVEPPVPLQPFIKWIFPRGGRQGTDFGIVVQGRYLGSASRLRFSGSGITARIVECTDSQIVAHVSIARNAAVGRRDLRVFTPQGTFVQVFQVGALPEQFEKEPNDDWSVAPVMEIPAIINGKVLPGDYDHSIPRRFRTTSDLRLEFVAEWNAIRWCPVIARR
jgi:hypothetical protein